jgi:hypothetical protein
VPESQQPGIQLPPSLLSLDVDGRVLRIDTFSKLLGPGWVGVLLISTLFKLLGPGWVGVLLISTLFKLLSLFGAGVLHFRTLSKPLGFALVAALAGIKALPHEGLHHCFFLSYLIRNDELSFPVSFADTRCMHVRAAVLCVDACVKCCLHRNVGWWVRMLKKGLC